MPSYFFEELTAFKYGSLLRKILSSRKGWKEEAEGTVTLSDKNSRSKFKSYLDGDKIISLKYNLASFFSDLPFMPATYLVLDGNMKPAKGTRGMQEEGIWFLKPSDKFTGEGKDILLFRSPSDFLEKKGSSAGIPTLANYPRWVLQKEVYPPFLFEGKKVIIRFFVTCFAREGVIFFYSGKKARVNIGAKPYPKEPTLDEAVMISHNTENLTQGTGTFIGSREGIRSLDGRRVELTEAMEKVFKDMESSMKLLLTRAADNFHPVDPFVFLVYGMDFSMDDRMNPFLIEVNEHPLLDFDPPIIKDLISFPMLENCVEVIEALDSGRKPLLEYPSMKALLKVRTEKEGNLNKE